MPGHKRRLHGHLPELFVKTDLTEIEGFDDLHYPQGILRELQQQAALLYGAEESYYLVNGSTCGILSAVSAALPPGGHLLVARNCHKSVYHGAYLRNLALSYLYPEYLAEYDIYEAVTPGQVRRALEETPGIGAVLIVSPTYEGRIAEVSAIVREVHRKGLPLIVDEAHGAHLGFFPGFAPSSCRLGADLVVHSVHKTLSGMTQTALLHVNGDRIDRTRLRRFLRIYQSSSPSYVLLAGIDNALRLVREEGEALFGELIRRWREMLLLLSACRNLTILSGGQGRQDVGKLLIGVKKIGLSARQLCDMLIREYHIQTEMTGKNCVLAMFTVGDTEEGFRRMTEALLEIDKKYGMTQEMAEAAPGWPRLRQEVSLSATACGGCVRPLPAFSLTTAWDGEKEECTLERSVGRYAAEFLMLSPPGVPFAVPGEILSEQAVEAVLSCLRDGLEVQGIQKKGKTYFLMVLMADLPGAKDTDAE
jgi:arginine/lysine/ornithine decarboxylase